MNRWLKFLMAPFVVFASIVALWGATSLLFFSANIIANILRAFKGWISGEFPRMLLRTFSDPWKIASLPIAVGVVILAGLWAWDDLMRKSGSQVMRGRELGSSRSHKRSRRTFFEKQGNQNNGRSRWTRSNPPRQ